VTPEQVGPEQDVEVEGGIDIRKLADVLGRGVDGETEDARGDGHLVAEEAEPLAASEGDGRPGVEEDALAAEPGDDVSGDEVEGTEKRSGHLAKTRRPERRKVTS
jgi:hypothetical protein